VNLQPGHLVGVSGNVIRVTSQWPCGNHVNEFEMFAKLLIRGQAGHKAYNFLPWQAFFPPLVEVVLMSAPWNEVHWTTLYRIKAYFSYIYIMCHHDVVLLPIFSKHWVT